MKKVGILVIGLILVGSNAWAFRGSCSTAPDMGMDPRIESNLNLSEDQKAQIRARQEALLDEISPLRNELFTKREELRQLWAKPDPDQSMISVKQEEIRDIQARVQERVTRHRLDCRDVLTREQREKLGTLTAYHNGSGGGHGRGTRKWQTNNGGQ